MLAIHNLILEEQRLFQVAHPVRYDGRRALPHAARRSGRLRGVMHGLALRAMSLRDGILLPYGVSLHQFLSSLVKLTMASTVM